jgi:hypothetical protein
MTSLFTKKKYNLDENIDKKNLKINKKSLIEN